MKIRKPQGDAFAPYFKKTRISTHAANADRYGEGGGAWPAQVDAFQDQVADAQDLFSAVEDLWLRLARHPLIHSVVKTNAITGERLVMFRQVGQGTQGKAEKEVREVADLLRQAARHSTYVWQGARELQCLVKRVEWCGDVLVIEVASSKQLERNADGEALDWQLCALSMKLQRIKLQQERMA